MKSFLVAVAPPPVRGPFIGSKLGMNLVQITDYSDQALTFVDIVKNARCFGPLPSGYYTYSNDVTLDSNGWPTTDFGMLVFAPPVDPLGRSIATNNPGMVGTYKLSFTGTATLASGDCTISNQVHNSGTNTTTADVYYAGTLSTITVAFSGTTGGCQNIILNRPGYAIGTTQVFTTEFLNSLKPFAAFRFMDFLATNNNPCTTWASRQSVTDPIQARQNATTGAAIGAAWEYVIELGNTTGKDIWINIPYGAFYDGTGADYVTSLANLIKNTLNAGIHVYVEYSNELWNGQFGQTTNLTTAAATAEGGGDPLHLNWDGLNNGTYWALRFQAYRTMLIANIFKSVFGSAFSSTIRVVLMTQDVQPYFAQDMLYYLLTYQSASGAPNTYLYGIGGAPYIAVEYTSGGTATAQFTTLNALFASLNTNAGGSDQLGYTQMMPYLAETPAFTGGDTATNPPAYMKPVADYYGLKCLAYEAGIDLGPNGYAIAEQSQGDSRTATFITNVINTWFNNHNDMFMYYQLATGPGAYWGIYEDVTLPTTKSNVMITLAALPLPP